MIKKIAISTFFDILKNKKRTVRECIDSSVSQYNSKISDFQSYFQQNKD
ncbi:MAG: hypothetical protein PWQ17_1328 [Anaerophaga sp.]|jgi:hypothetical protein|nr:hypothetical protein [Anaerophaga sp.]